MSDQPPRDDDPTSSYRPFGGGDDEPTRMETPIPPYDPDRPAPLVPGEPQPDPNERHNKWIAPLITVALLAILIGVAVGWFLFGDSSDNNDDDTTTTTTQTSTIVPGAVASTTTVAPTTSTQSTTTSAVRSSSTVRVTTTVKPTTTKAPTTTAAGDNPVVGAP